MRRSSVHSSPWAFIASPTPSLKATSRPPGPQRLDFSSSATRSHRPRTPPLASEGRRPPPYPTIRAVAFAGRQQRLLNRRRDRQLLLELGLVERFAVEARVLDRQRRLGRQRVERGDRRRRSQGAALAAVEIQHPDDFLRDFLLGPL